MRCLFKVEDDLHDYAEAVQARMSEHLAAKPLSLQSCGGFDCAVVHRMGNLQVELVHISPGEVVPMHRHPGVDSIDLLVEGNVSRFQIGDHSVSRFVRGMGLRIAQDAMHGGTAGMEGVLFLSCQRWAMQPSHISLVWRGDPCSVEHMSQLLEAVR